MADEPLQEPDAEAKRKLLLKTLRSNIPPLPDLENSVDITDVEQPGYVRFTVNVPETLKNYRGTIHGGTIYFIGEIGAGFAMSSFGRSNVCSSATINFFKSVPCCTVEASTQPLHIGRSTAVIRVTMRQAETGALIAESTHNMFLFASSE